MRMMKKIFAAVFLLAVIAGIGWFCFPIGSMTVAGSEIYSEEEIKDELFDGPTRDNAICLYLKNRFFGLDAMPFIGEVQLEWTSMKDVVVRVYEKSLVACFAYMGEYVYFDKDGVVLESSGERMEGIPLVEGIPYTDFVMNEPIKLEEEQLFGAVLDVSQLIKHNQIDVDKVEFGDRDEVTLSCGGVEVALGNREEHDQQMAALPSVLKRAANKGLKGRIDMTNFVEGGKIFLQK